VWTYHNSAGSGQLIALIDEQFYIGPVNEFQ
jgi:hypothetical protein